MTPRPFRTARRLGKRALGRRYRGYTLVVVIAAAAATGLLSLDRSVLERYDLDRAACPAPTPPSGPPSVVARVVDADTLELADGRQVRLYCADAPETQWRQRGTPWCAAYDAGKAAKDAVVVLTLNQPVTFGHREGDSSGRDMAAEVYLPDGTELGAWLIANGHAVARPDLTDAGRHLPDPAITDACPPGVPGGSEPSR